MTTSCSVSVFRYLSLHAMRATHPSRYGPLSMSSRTYKKNKMHDCRWLGCFEVYAMTGSVLPITSKDILLSLPLMSQSANAICAGPPLPFRYDCQFHANWKVMWPAYISLSTLLVLHWCSHTRWKLSLESKHDLKVSCWASP